MKGLPLILLVSAIACLTGCAGGVSTYGGESTFKCAAKFEEGVPCDSISGTSANFNAGNLSWQRKEATTSSPKDITANVLALQTMPPVIGAPNPGSSSGPTIERISPRQMPTPTAGMPLRVPERVLRIWVAPFEDEEGALNDQKYLYLTVQRGTWLVEANKLNLQSSYKRITPLGSSKKTEVDPVDQRAVAKTQAQGAVLNNPNITNMPSRPRSSEQDTE